MPFRKQLGWVSFIFFILYSFECLLHGAPLVGAGLILVGLLFFIALVVV